LEVIADEDELIISDYTLVITDSIAMMICVCFLKQLVMWTKHTASTDCVANFAAVLASYNDYKMYAQTQQQRKLFKFSVYGMLF